MDAENQYHNNAFFLAYTTVPPSKSSQLFFKEDIEEIFTSYISSLKKMSENAGKKSIALKMGNDAKSAVYKPIPYFLFGDFDLAVFSLIDDFSFASRKFKPGPDGENFKYQVNTGLIPLIYPYRDKSWVDKFKDDLNRFFNQEEFYPFTGITSVKLNNAMMVGVGQEFIRLINFYLVILIDQYISEQKEQIEDFKMFYAINENLGWNELNIYFFGNSISAIADISSKFKTKTLAEIKTELEQLDLAKYDQQERDEKLNTLSQKIKEESLLQYFISKEESNDTKDYLCSHPVIASSTAYGFHFDNINNVSIDNRYQFKKISPAEMVLITKEFNQKIVSIAWNIKPGHEAGAYQLFQNSLPVTLKKELSSSLNDSVKDVSSEKLKTGSELHSLTQGGKYACIFPNRLISLFDYFNFFKVANNNYKEDISHNIIKFRSAVNFKNSITVLSSEDLNTYNSQKKAHYNYGLLKKYKIQNDEFQAIQKSLRVFPVPHTVKGQIENLILNFNDVIIDPLMYNYFIGLKGSLLNFLKDKFPYEVKKSVDRSNQVFTNQPYIRPGKESKIANTLVGVKDVNNKSQPVSIAHKQFTDFINDWNKAYWNRHFHGHHFTEINDFNIEHHGGIQQIVFCYDIIYKIICKKLYGDMSPDPFVNVRIDPAITSARFNTTLNFTHLFKPAIFACECVHEAANHVIHFLVNNTSSAEFSFLLNPKDSFDEFTILRARKFETAIKKAIGSKDAFEVDFIEEYMGLNSIRYLFTDYISFSLAYNFEQDKSVDLQKQTLQNLEIYAHTHWFLFLTRADLYLKPSGEDRNWYFNEVHFKFLFIRINLMFYVMCNCTSDELHTLNQNCPAAELNGLWITYRKSLIDFVARMGDAIKAEFKNMPEFSNNNDSASLEAFKKIINDRIIMNETPAFYTEVIAANYSLIKYFHDNFHSSQQLDDTDYYNTIIRKSDQDDQQSNIDFYPNHSRNIFLDPKGNIFSISESKRLEILKKNVEYLKKIWNIAMLAAKDLLYKQEE